jgi:KDO2-lipid IV(A) lauroyltransferase
LAHAVSWLTSWLPRRLGYQLTDGLSRLAWPLAGRYRRAAIANLGLVLDRQPTDPVVIAAAQGCFRTSGRNFWDLASLPHLTATELERRTIIEPAIWSLFERLLAQRRGLIIVTAHLGAFDLVSQLLHNHTPPLLILTARTTSTWLFETVTRLRASWGAIVEPASTGTLRQTIGHLRQGGTLGLVIDRDIDRTGRPVRLCGRLTTVPVGAARIARETGAPIIAIFCPRDGLHYRLIAEAVPVRRSHDETADLTATLADLAAILERAIQTWPDQWVCFQPIWPASDS